MIPVTQVPVPVALIDNSMTPYRLNLHSRLAEEMPEVQIWSAFTHDASNSPWRLQAPEEIRPVFFGPKERSADGDSIRAQGREWRKAGAILQWMHDKRIRAVIL